MQGDKLQNAFFIGLLILVSVGFFALLSGFFQPIFWAAIIGIIFLPVQHYLENKFGGHRTLAAIITVILIFFTVLLPALLIASAVINEAAIIFGMIQSGEIDPGVLLRWLREMSPQLIERAESIGIDVDQWPAKLSAVAVKGSQFIGQLALIAGQNVANFLVMFFMMLYLLFFVLRDGDRMLEAIILALPLGDERERALFAKFAEVSRATIKGTLLIGLVQGFLGGVMFSILGVTGAVFWGVVMVIFSILPLVGASIVWIPVAIFLLVSGAWIKALVLAVFGVLVIGLIDNLLRPILIGRDTKMPDYIILLSTLGGLSIFGISGFVIGPIVASLFLAVWVMFQEEHVG
ncbi:MAG: AI-2E family transporter [Gammaproteobacteria bacterium]|nr:MAG: AI-2E family transporter [Gammaproteobacteria bacterium]